MPIRIMNIRQHDKCPYDVRIDRPTILGNPFRATDLKSVRDRYTAIDRFRKYAYERFDKDKGFFEKIAWLGEKFARGEVIHLCCWCAPLPCHGRIVRTMIEEWAYREILKQENPWVRNHEEREESGGYIKLG